MSYDYDNALKELAKIVANPAYTKAELLNLAKQVDVSNAKGSITVLYSRMGDVPAAMATDPNIRILDKTDAFKFLTSNAFNDALGGAIGLTLDEMQDKNPLSDPVKQALKEDLLNWNFHGTDGPWAGISKKFR
ncbi:hypothetical protein [Methylocucumis oryzae]|nr:hypothetical protein [Methylocucumis oryzae]